MQRAIEADVVEIEFDDPIERGGRFGFELLLRLFFRLRDAKGLSLLLGFFLCGSGIIFVIVRRF